MTDAKNYESSSSTDENLLQRIERHRIKPPEQRDRVIDYLHQTILTAIQKAPFRSHSKNDNEGPPIIDSTIAFDAQQDSHYLPLFEKVAFEELVKYHNSHYPADVVDPLFLMILDPQYPRIEKTLRNGKQLRGESLTEHELQHSFHDQYEGFDQGYICFTFIKEKTPSGSNLIIEAGHLNKVMLVPRHTPVYIRGLYAPRYPSPGDLSAAKEVVKYSSEVSADVKPIKEADRASKRKLTRYHGMIVDALDLQKHLQPQWIQLRKGEIKGIGALPNR